MPLGGAPRWSFARLRSFRAGNGPHAWLICSIGAALTGSTFFTVGMAAYGRIGSVADLVAVSAGRLLLGSILSLLLILVATAIVAPPVTWLAARLRFEHPIFYVPFGAGCGYLAAGMEGGSEPGAFLFSEMLLFAAPIFGGTWGLLWWLIYRRHIARGSDATGTAGSFE